MNVTLLLNNDIASNFALNLLLPTLAVHNVSVFLSSKVGGNSKRPEALQALAVFEQSGVYQQMTHQRPSSSNRRFHFKTFAQLADKHAIEINVLNDINSPDGIAKIAANQPDLIVSVRYGVILKSAVLALANYGVINLHSGKLPMYRGVMASFWAMLKQEKTIGTTLHFIDDKTIDTGRIIACSELAINTDKSYLWHVLSLYIVGCKNLTDTIEKIASQQKLMTSEQPIAGGYYSFPMEDELAQFSLLGLVLYKPQEIIELINTNMQMFEEKVHDGNLKSKINA
jgi:methionyl-tRNA formyltransferase